MIQKKAEKPILTVPVSSDAELIAATIRSGNEFLKLEIPAAQGETFDFLAEYPLPFPPEQTVVESEEALFRRIAWKDHAEKLSDPPGVLRPRFHFSPACGWLNDPNGLFWLNGEWHLFFQYNPFSCRWGNMHWKHATSRDLIHWEEKEIVLYPDSFGTMFSGSAVVDRENAAGFGKEAILLFYTNAFYDGGSSQSLAFSTDGGKTFRKYGRNPILPGFSGFCDRDPAVVFDPEEACWRMALYLGDESKRTFLLLRSENLLNWSVTDSWNIENGRECPILLRMRDESDGVWKWVFAEANGCYRIGRIQKGRVLFESESRRFLCGDAYAGQCFANSPGENPVFLAWLRMPEPVSKRYCGMMSSPMKLSLSAGRLRVSPFVLCGRSEPFETVGSAEKPLPEGNVIFDVKHHQIRFRERSWDLPSGISALKGRFLLDATSLEYFDDSGLFAFCLTCRTGE